MAYAKKVCLIIAAIFCLAFSGLASHPAMAIDTCGDPNVSAEVKKLMGCQPAAANQLPSAVSGIITGVIAVLGLVAVGFIIKGGVNYMTSAGDPTKIKTAKATILYAAIGLIIVMLSFAIVNWVIGLGTSNTRPATTSEDDEEDEETGDSGDTGDGGSTGDSGDTGDGGSTGDSGGTGDVTPKPVTPTISIADTIKKLVLNKTNDMNPYNIEIEVKPTGTKLEGLNCKSADTNIAKAVIKDGKCQVTPQGVGKTDITISADNVASVKQELANSKKIIFIVTASQGARWQKWTKGVEEDFTPAYVYKSKDAEEYKDADSTLNIIYKPGEGYEYQTTTGLQEVQKELAKYEGQNDYVTPKIIFTLSGNDTKKYSCDEAQNKLAAPIEAYKNAIANIQRSFKNTKGFVTSQLPLVGLTDMKKMNDHGIVYSNDAAACDAKKRSNLKYSKMNDVTKGMVQSHGLTYIDVFGVVLDTAAPDAKDYGDGHKDYEYKDPYNADQFATYDGLHFGKKTSKRVLGIILKNM